MVVRLLFIVRPGKRETAPLQKRAEDEDRGRG
jgi:hypothetical protein